MREEDIKSCIGEKVNTVIALFRTLNIPVTSEYGEYGGRDRYRYKLHLNGLGCVYKISNPIKGK